MRPDNLKKMIGLKNYEAAEFYKTVIIYENGKPVVTGCLNITQAAIKQNDAGDDDNVDLKW